MGPPTNIEKDFSPYNQGEATPAEIFAAERDMTKGTLPDLPTMITMKEEGEERRASDEMEELMRMREENPVMD